MEQREKRRVAIIIMCNLYAAPYVRYYTNILEQLNIPYDIISWNRSGTEEAGVLAFNLKEHKSRFFRIIDYIRYRNFVKSKLAEGAYGKVIIPTIFVMLLIFRFLKTKFRNNYIFDIRDYCIVLKLKYFRDKLDAAIRNAALVVISSEGFKQWLPKDASYLIGHNVATAERLGTLVNIEGNATYKILTIGFLKHFNAYRALTEALADDPAFELEFVGTGYHEQMLRDFVASRNITNVSLHGRYAKEDEPKFLEKVSLVNILTVEDINTVTLMTNRFYLSLSYGVPMMVYENTEQARWVEKYNLGVVIKKQSDMKEQIIHYLTTFDSEQFNAGCITCLQRIERDIQAFEAGVIGYLKQPVK